MSSSTPQPTVYIVDDDQATRKSLRWLVETLGVPVQTFHCAVSFLDAYDAAMPGCVVLDMMMPGMNGLELQRSLVERGIDIPVIVLTGYADVPTAVRALEKRRRRVSRKTIQRRRALGANPQSVGFGRSPAERARHFGDRPRTHGPLDAP